MGKQPTAEMEVQDQFSAFLDEYLKADRDKSRQRFEATDALVRKNLADLFARWPQAVKEAGLDEEAPSHEKELSRGPGRRGGGGHPYSQKLLRYGLRLRDLLAKLDADSPEMLLRAAGDPPSNNWYSAGLGAIVFRPYTVKIG